ncbi:MAG: serine/threonine protein kinase, partial [Alphaproteobacteria bacterium]
MKLDRYTIVNVLGEGGFGVTYLAEDKQLGKKFAIKEYFPQSWSSRDESDSMSVRINSAATKDYSWGLDRFKEEARTLAKFRHPNIVNVNSILDANNTAYMVLDYEDGDNFETWLRNLGRPPTQEELDAIVEPILDALELIHSNKILHRDIAPDNLYIRGDGSPVLLDFGSARDAIGHRTKTVSAIIKMGYSPIEQYSTAGKDQGPWTDIYSLGATLYRAIAGKRLPEATERALKDEYVPAAQAAQGEYRSGFLHGIDMALERHFTDRPQNIADWRAVLMSRDDFSGQETRVSPVHISTSGAATQA